MEFCSCSNTCARAEKRGACSCRVQGRHCTDLCNCGHLIMCVNRPDNNESGVPTCERAYEFLTSEDEWSPHKDSRHGIGRKRHYSIVEPPAVPTKIPLARKKILPSSVRKTRSKPAATTKPPCPSLLRIATPAIRSAPQPRQPVSQPPQSPVPTRYSRIPVPVGQPATQPKSRIPVRVSRQSTPPPSSATRHTIQQVPPVIPSPSHISAACTAVTDGELDELAGSQHRQQIQQYVQSLDSAAIQRVLAEVLLRDTEAFLEYVHGYLPPPILPEAAAVAPANSDPQPPHQDEVPAWCFCGNCRPMPKEMENRCCTTARGQQQCISTLPVFRRVVLDEGVGNNAAAYRNDIYVFDHHRTNQMFRHTAYRQYVLMRYGVLRKGERKVVPSCCVLAIRRRYPSTNGHYKGFVLGRY